MIGKITIHMWMQFLKLFLKMQKIVELLFLVLNLICVQCKFYFIYFLKLKFLKLFSIDNVIVNYNYNHHYFSSLKLKQPVYPIFFLTTGGHPRYGANKDRRANSIADAVLYAASQKVIFI